jgi:hypothetical protein
MAQVWIKVTEREREGDGATISQCTNRDFTYSISEKQA